MPLEGIPPSGQVLPPHHLLEAAALAALESKLEHHSQIKKLEHNEKAKAESNETDKEGKNPASGRYNKERETSQNQSLVDKPKILKYTIKYNEITELVELIDLKTQKVIQTINPKDLIALIAELKYTSGLFVDNQI